MKTRTWHGVTLLLLAGAITELGRAAGQPLQAAIFAVGVITALVAVTMIVHACQTQREEER